MTQSQFFAVKDDLSAVTCGIEERSRLQYVRMGIFENAEPQSFDSAMQLPGFGLADTGSSSSCAQYLICKADTRIQVRSISLEHGGTRYAVDQLANPDTITFTPAGIWTDEILIAGSLGTASDTAAAKDLMKLFRTTLRKHFTKVKAFYVGPLALGQLSAGKRLTYSEQSPREFDLAL